MAADSNKRAARLAQRIGAFTQRHGGSAEAQIAYVGQVGFRISLVGADGTWGDQMAPSKETAEEAVRACPDVTLKESFDGEMAEHMRTGPYEWSRMAGTQLGGPANR
ncbi:hypothetical protein [Streptomyces spirodelae]|uniref:Uncharacterized protein n=1 Tax=Streptomyces spirodelae TaxID=2812904 RepID=A0ABS3WYU7_9ACTN|nr:hypothetical protein [Streptomyces spirodelae]MBO8188310.1 hypothetical protein [Streptomyces spirodelae]